MHRHCWQTSVAWLKGCQEQLTSTQFIGTFSSSASTESARRKALDKVEMARKGFDREKVQQGPASALNFTRRAPHGAAKWHESFSSLERTEPCKAAYNTIMAFRIVRK